MPRATAILAFTAALCCATAAAQTITTHAGGSNGDGFLATATVAWPSGAVVDVQGNIYFAEVERHRVRKVDAGSGIVTTIAGDGTPGFSGDGGPAINARLQTPFRVALDGAGNLYISDNGNRRVRRISGGIITTIAGNGTAAYNGDGIAATSASVTPFAMAFDGAGNMFIADGSHNRIRKVSAGTITTVAGNGNGAFGGDGGPATSAMLSQPFDIVVDAAGTTLYIADLGNNRIRKVTAGTITTVAGNGTNGFGGDNGPATSAMLSGGGGIAVQADGTIFIADQENHRVRKVSGGTITTFAGDGSTSGASGDGGPATAASLYPKSVTLVGTDLYISEGLRLRKVPAAGGTITTVAGNGFVNFAGDGGPATSAMLDYAGPMAIAANGDLVFADSGRIRRVSAATGVISTIAGNGAFGLSPDGTLATEASMSPQGLAFDSHGVLHFVDNNRVRKIDAATGVITTVAGNGAANGGDGGPATGAGLQYPVSIGFDPAGNLYIAESNEGVSDRIRVVNATTGIIQTLAGGGTVGFAGDGGPATAAVFSIIWTIAFDPAGNLYVADSQNYRVRKIDMGTGKIDTVAGNGTPGFSGDGGPATSASIGSPAGMAFDAAGGLYFIDYDNFRVRKVSGGVISTIAGNGTNGFAGDGGPATGAAFNNAQYVALDRQRHLFIADSSNQRVRRVDFPVILATTPSPLDFGGQSMGTRAPTRIVTVTNNGSQAMTISGVSITGAGFAQANDCANLAPAASCAISVDFSPLAAAGAINSTAAAAGEIAIASNDAFTPTRVPLAGLGEKSLVTHYYRSILRRAPDTGGKAFWTSEAARMQQIGANVNEAWFAMAQFFFFSAEYLGLNRDTTGFVTDLYKTFFNRDPDGGGLAFWAGQVNAGMPREVVLASFMFSPEFASFAQAIFGATAARAEIDVVMDFYRGVLARLPDPSGFDSWVQQFRTAQCTGAGAVYGSVESISSAFAGGSEYAVRSRTNAQYVGDLYNAFLRRGGDLGGVQFWINELAASARTREQVRQNFVASAEFQGRVNAVVNQGCSP